MQSRGKGSKQERGQGRARRRKGNPSPHQISLDLALSNFCDRGSGVRKGWPEQSFQVGGEVSRIAGMPEDLAHSMSCILKGDFLPNYEQRGKNPAPSIHHVLLLKIIILEYEAVSCL